MNIHRESAAFLVNKFAPSEIVIGYDGDGGDIHIRSTLALADHAETVLDWLDRWARDAASRAFLVERGGDGNWRAITYAETRERVDAVSCGFVSSGLTVGDRLMIISDNSVAAAVVMLAAMRVGVSVTPVSSAYALADATFGKLLHAVQLIDPAAVYVPAFEPFIPALEKVGLFRPRPSGRRPLIVTAEAQERSEHTTLNALAACSPTQTHAAAVRAVNASTIGKILLTSGSTGLQKGVINTQEMMCANGVAINQVWPLLENHPPIICDWLPWSHTFACNFNFNNVMRNGGTYYIDQGKPTEALFERTLENLADVRPTILCNVPRGYDMFVRELRDNRSDSNKILSRVDLIFYAGAALPENIWHELRELTIQARGHTVPIVSTLGSTETGPTAILGYNHDAPPGCVGLPVPGCELKLVRNEDRLELRMRGSNITPGYWNNPEATAMAFDDDGFYKIGDAVRFVDPLNPARGLMFDGRMSENFKLLTGTWVNVGILRAAFVAAAAPSVIDAVVTGHDRDEIGMLAIPCLDECKRIAGVGSDSDFDEIFSSPRLHAFVRGAIGRLNKSARGSSERIARVMFFNEVPTMETGEVNEKGYINQRLVIRNREAEITRLYSEHPYVIKVGD